MNSAEEQKWLNGIRFFLRAWGFVLIASMVGVTYTILFADGKTDPVDLHARFDHLLNILMAVLVGVTILFGTPTVFCSWKLQKERESQSTGQTGTAPGPT